MKKENIDNANVMLTMLNRFGCAYLHEKIREGDGMIEAQNTLHNDRADYWNLMGCLSRGNALHAETLIEQHIIEWEHS